MPAPFAPPFLFRILSFWVFFCLIYAYNVHPPFDHFLHHNLRFPAWPLHLRGTSASPTILFNLRASELGAERRFQVMVCQGASFTRFRALKHESGISGHSTMIVRVIACFQPVQTCQAEYFRQLLKPVT